MIYPYADITCTVLFTCCRDGHKRDNTQPRKTLQTRKRMASRKMLDSYCIARMTATEYKSGKVTVRYIATHTNHELGIHECKHLPMPQSVMKDIQEKFSQGLTLEHIMDGMLSVVHVCFIIYLHVLQYIIMILLICWVTDIRGDLGKRHCRNQFLQSATRRHFLTRQDCRNASRKVRNFTRHRHTHDAISVNRIVTELRTESPSPLLAYKPQGVKDETLPTLSEDTFFLVLMTEFQASLFTTFSHKIVCLDSTHKTNQYRFKLLTLVVPDEFRNGKHMYLTKCGVT